MTPVSVFACESQPIVLAGLAKVLAQEADFHLLGSAASLNDARDCLSGQHPDVLLVDQSAGLKLVFQFVSDVKSATPACQPVLWVSDLAEMDCFRALQMGIRGVLKKTGKTDSVLDCLRAVSRGEVWMEGALSERERTSQDSRPAPRLTPREREIVQLICEGMKNKEVAEALGITAGTVKVHLMHIFEKTGVKDRFELAITGRRILAPARVPPAPDQAPRSGIALLDA